MKRLIELWNKYERHISVVTLVCGFTFDLILAKRPDSIADNILLLFYLGLSASIIVVLNMRSRREQEGIQTVQPLFLLLVLQFCFGGLASNLLILYGKSGSLGGTTIFLALLLCMLVGNEMLKNRYAQFKFNIGVYYFLLLTYLVIALPTFVFHRIGTQIFLVSGIVSLLLIAFFLWAIFRLVLRGDKKKQILQVGSIVLGIYVAFNGLYFLNVIPPVPLSLKAAGIYHSVERTASGDYAVTYEKKHWWEFWRDTSDMFTVQAGEPAYCFSAVFAPGKLTTPIVHTWEYLYPADENHKRSTWLPVAKVEFPITGGREEGYRGFSEKRVLADGQWRCTVSTASGQVIGYITFNVVSATSTPALSSGVL
ncbi:MAG TPA: DUF2914 domain-containing protein [Candidatus Paceibacterota bacterium]|nr:DUF2914 domain-containing protein [Candidatus Paceibacterota bacterium]